MSKAEKRRALIVLLAAIAMNFTVQLAAYYATSGPLPSRAAIVPLFATFAAIVVVLHKNKHEPG